MPCTFYTATATATAAALTDIGTVVTATSSFTATSSLSYADALKKAQQGANDLARETAIYDADIINQAINDTILTIKLGVSGFNGTTGATGSIGTMGFTGATGAAGVIQLSGVNYGDYIYWGDSGWAIGDMNITLGSSAGSNNQTNYSIAIGYHAGESGQGTVINHDNSTGNAIAIGSNAGQYAQGSNAIAIGSFAYNPIILLLKFKT